MAVKISSAIDNDNRKITVSTAENSDYCNPLRCEFCGAQLSFVNGFPRESKDNIVNVKPFFRLKKGYIHDIKCKYNVEGQIRILARESEKNLFTLNESGKYELRLLAVRNALLEIKKSPFINSQNEEILQNIDKKYIKSKERLVSYINSALRVVRFRSLCEDNKEIEKALELVFDGVRIQWNDFYYDEERYFKCFSFLKNSTVKTPIAIKGIINNIKITKNNFKVINLKGQYKKTKKGDTLDTVNISIWSKDLSAFKKYDESDEILVFGIFQAKDIEENLNKKSENSIKFFRNHNIYLDLISNSQLCKVIS